MATKKQLESWKLSLHHQSIDENLKALHEIGAQGSADILPELFELALFAKAEKVKAESLKILQNLKASNAESYFFNAFKNEKYQQDLPILLGAFWQSNLDASGHLQTLIDIALRSKDYLVGFECFTIIENNKSQFNDTELIESIKNIQTYLEMGHAQKELLSDIRSLLSDLLTDKD